jgi:hypothetical protein
VVVVTLDGLPFNASMISFQKFGCSKKWIDTWQNNVHMLSFPILNLIGFTLGRMAQATH